MKTVHIACAGAWHTHAKDFADRLEKIPDCELVAVWDENPEVAEQWGREKGCRWYTDFDELVRSPEIDGIIITCETTRHADLIIRAVNAGKHVYVEKALTATVEQAYEVQKAVHAAEQKYGVRFALSDPIQKGVTLYAKKLMDAGAFGKVLSVRCRSGHNLALTDPDSVSVYQHPEGSGGGVLLDMGHHAVHTLLFLLGKPERGAALFSTVTPLSQETGAEDYCTVEYQFPSGTIGVAEGSLVSARHTSGLEIVGTEGYLISRNGSDACFIGADGVGRVISQEELAEAWMAPQAYWIKCIHDGVPCEMYQVDEAVEIVKMISMAYSGQVS